MYEDNGPWLTTVWGLGSIPIKDGIQWYEHKAAKYNIHITLVLYSQTLIIPNK